MGPYGSPYFKTLLSQIAFWPPELVVHTHLCGGNKTLTRQNDKSQSKAFKLFVNFLPNGPNRTTFGIFEILIIEISVIFFFLSLWQLFWHTQTGNKLHEIHPKIGLWKSSLQLSRKDQVLLTRCLIHVHSRLTHSFLLNNEPVPECVFCACPLTIRSVYTG